jgi:hypothetical protein
MTQQHSLSDALTYNAPFLIEKLLKDHIVESVDEAQTLFLELKRYFVLVRSDDDIPWKMYSLRIDEVWHQFVLFTWEYINFCERYFGTYIQHNPSNAPEWPKKSVSQGANGPSSFEGFKERYEKLFGGPLPEVWYDEKSITPRRRVLHSYSNNLVLRDKDEIVDLLDAKGDVLLSVNKIARDALAFVARTGAFYVRELPGLTDEEQIALIATLVEYKLLRVGA